MTATVPHKIEHLMLIYQNVRGLNTNLTEFYQALLLNEGAIVAITESWLTPAVLNTEAAPNSYVIYRADRAPPKKGGGVLLAIPDAFTQDSFDMSSLDVLDTGINAVAARIHIINKFFSLNRIVYTPQYTRG